MPRDTADQRLGVRFYHQYVENPAETEKAGRPIYDDREMITIVIPGHVGDEETHTVTDRDRERFPEEYARFQTQEELSASGTPLKEWSRIRGSRSLELAHFGIHTVEQLAAINPKILEQIGDTGPEEVTAAKAFVEQSGDPDAAARYAIENDGLRQDIKTKDEQIADLKDELKKAKAAAK